MMMEPPQFVQRMMDDAERERQLLSIVVEESQFLTDEPKQPKFVVVDNHPSASGLRSRDRIATTGCTSGFPAKAVRIPTAGLKAKAKLEGLLASKMYETAKRIVTNLIHLIEKYGHVLNGARADYTNRR